MIQISNSLYLSVVQAIYGNPIIGYQSFLDINNVLADFSPDETPDINLVNEHTHQFWESDSTDEQNLYFYNDDLADVDYIGIARHNFGSGNISYQLQGNPDRPWTIGDAAFAEEYNIPFGSGGACVHFKPDGTRMFVGESSNPAIHQFTLSTPWDVSTASVLSSYYFNGDSPATFNGFWIKPDGTKLYAVAADEGLILQYTIATPWDVTTATYDSVFFNTALGSNRNIFFRPDGLKLYITTDSAGQSQPDRVRQYTLSVAWNVSTAVYDSIFLDVASQSTGPFGCFFHPSGRFFYITDQNGGQIEEYVVSTPWDLNTASHNTSFTVSAQEGAPRSVFFHPDGIKFYIVGSSSGDVHQYDIADEWFDITEDAIPENDGAIIHYFSNTNYSQYRIKLIPDETPPQVAHIKLGAALVLPQSIYVGHSPITLNRRTEIVTNTSENGQFLGRIEKRRYLQTAVDMAHIEPDFYRDYIDPFVEHAETGAFFFAWRPAGYPKEVGYGWTGGDITPENQMPNGMMQFSFNMKAVA